MPDAPNVTSRTLAFNELGKTGLVRMGGTVYEEFLPQLTGPSGVRIFKEMRDNSAIIGAVLFAIDSMMRSVDWFIEPASEDDGDIEAARFVEECRHDMSHTWEEFISEVMTMLVFGWSYFEVVYKRRKGPDARASKNRSKYDDGRIGWRKFAPRSQDTLFKWKFDADGGIAGMIQQPPPTGDPAADRQTNIFIPIRKSLLFRTTSSKNNPEGKSILRNAFRSWHFLKRIQEIEAVGTERNLAGLPIAYVPVELLATDRSDAATATYNVIKDIVTRTKRDEQEGIIFPLAYDENGNEMFKFELMAAGGTSARSVQQTREIVKGYQQEIAMTAMADFILLGHEVTGSFALSSDKTELFSIALEAWLDEIEAVINRHAIPRLMELNTFDVAAGNYPKVRHGDIETPNLAELGGFVAQLAGAGATLFPDLLLENKLRQAADLPEITAEEYEERREQARQEEMEANMPMGPGFGGGARPSRPAGPESGATGSPRSNGGGRRTFSFDRPVRSVDGRGRGES